MNSKYKFNCHLNVTLFILTYCAFFSSFDHENRYIKSNLPPIDVDTVVEIDEKTGKIIKKWGSKFFYLPHGLTIDINGNYWLTDVALHQVFKFDLDQYNSPSLTIGKEFIPGKKSLKNLLCKPTSVAINSDNLDIYIADGYCNNRLVKFNSKGEYLMEYKVQNGYNTMLNIPHKVILIKEINSVCTANRENGEIICFNINNSKITNIIKNEKFNGKIYSIHYSHCYSGLIFLVDGPYKRTGKKSSAFALNLKDNNIIANFDSVS